MSFNNFGLGFVFQGVDRVSGTALKVNSVLTQVAKSSKELNAKLTDPKTGKFLGAHAVGKMFEKDAGMAVAGVATMSAGLMGIRGAVRAANIAGEFEQGLAGISAVAKATDAEMAKARDSVIAAGMNTQFSPTEALGGMAQLVTAGQTIEESTKTLIPVLDLAAGSMGNLSIDKAANAIIGTMNSYGMSAEAAVGVTNKLLRVTQLTNFATNDFESALGKAASTASMYGTGLDETLIMIGAMRNANIDASSSGTGFQEAVRRIGGMKAQQDKIAAAGVDVYDKESGKMRDTGDILFDLVDATKAWNESKRQSMLNLVLGSRGSRMFNAMQRMQFKTMKDGVLVTYEGREAYARQRAEMAMAGGEIAKLTKITAGWADQQWYLNRATTEAGKTAQEFREKLLDTFAGQKQLLDGIMQTIVIQLGEPLSKAFKPVVAWLANTFTNIARTIESLSPATKAFIAKIFVMTSVLFAVGGAIVAARIGFIAFNAAMGMVGASARSIFAGFMRLNMIARVVAGGAYLMYMAYRENLGGIADKIHRLATVITLAFQGLQQLFSAGGFSGGLRHELNKAENSGIKAFVIQIYAIGMRIKAFFEGVGTGFMEAWKAVGPVVMETFNVVKGALMSLLGALGILSVDGEGMVSVNIATFRRWGMIVGKSIAIVILVLAKVISFIAGFIARHPTLVQTVLYGAVAWKLLNVAMTMSMTGFHAVKLGMTMVAGGVGTIIKSLHALKLAMLANPILAIAMAVATVAFLIYDNWDWLVANVWQPFADTISWIGSFIVDTLGGAWEGFKKGCELTWKGLKKVVWDPFVRLLVWIDDAFGGAISGSFSAMVNAFQVTWDAMKKYVWDPFMWVINGIIDGITWIWDNLPSFGDVADTLTFGGYTASQKVAQASAAMDAEKEMFARRQVARKADPEGFGGFANEFAGGFNATPSAAMGPMVANAQGQAAQTGKIAELGSRPQLTKEDLAKVVNSAVDRPVVVQIDGATIATAVSTHSAKNDAMSFGAEEGFWDG